MFKAINNYVVVDENKDTVEGNEISQIKKDERPLLENKHKHSLRDLRRRPSHHNSKPRLSIVSMGSMGLSITNLDKQFKKGGDKEKMSLL